MNSSSFYGYSIDCSAIIVGSVNADLIVNVPRLPSRGETISAESTRSSSGGKGANQAAGLARIGARSSFVGSFGSDDQGTTLRKELEESFAVNTALSLTSSRSSGSAVILLEPGGLNTIVCSPGANKEWPKDPLSPELLDAIRTTNGVLLQREIPDDVNLLIADAANKAKVPVFFDFGGTDTPLPPGLIQTVTYACPNEIELYRATSISNPLEGARKLLSMGAKNVLVTLGSKGAMLLTEDGDIVRQPAVDLKAKGQIVLDTTGAGDSFRAAFAGAMITGWPAPIAMRFATCAAAICVQRADAMRSLPSWEEILAEYA